MDRQNLTKHRTKRLYTAPKLVDFGNVRVLTRGGSGTKIEGGGGNPHRKPSERRVKENIVRIATHPLGIGLYRFNYKPGHREVWGAGTQFGVMADEVERVMPEAVSFHPDGYKLVSYGLLDPYGPRI